MSWDPDGARAHQREEQTIIVALARSSYKPTDAGLSRKMAIAVLNTHGPVDCSRSSHASAPLSHRILIRSPDPKGEGHEVPRRRGLFPGASRPGPLRQHRAGSLLSHSSIHHAGSRRGRTNGGAAL